jgi:hypothetical protein
MFLLLLCWFVANHQKGVFGGYNGYGEIHFGKSYNPRGFILAGSFCANETKTLSLEVNAADYISYIFHFDGEYYEDGFVQADFIEGKCYPYYAFTMTEDEWDHYPENTIIMQICLDKNDGEGCISLGPHNSIMGFYDGFVQNEDIKTQAKCEGTKLLPMLLHFAFY